MVNASLQYTASMTMGRYFDTICRDSIVNKLEDEDVSPEKDRRNKDILGYPLAPIYLSIFG